MVQGPRQDVLSATTPRVSPATSTAQPSFPLPTDLLHPAYIFLGALETMLRHGFLQMHAISAFSLQIPCCVLD